MIQQVLDFISIPFVGVLIGVIVSASFGIIPFFKLKKMNPRYITRFNNIIYQNEASYDGLEFRYNGEVISMFSETKIYFWNSGNGSIRDFHFLKDDPFGIKIDSEVDIYKVQSVTTDKMMKTFDVSFDIDGNIILIYFDSMLKNEGFYISIWHSGKNVDSIKVTGSFDGAKINGVTSSGRERKSRNEPSARSNLFAGGAYFWIYMFASLVYSFIAVYLLFPNIFANIWMHPIYPVIKYIIASISICTAVITPIFAISYYKGIIIPSKLDKAINLPERYVNYDIKLKNKLDVK